MGSRQPKVARIEAGIENLRLDTIVRLGEALDAQISLALVPREYLLPRLPPWWDYLDFGIHLGSSEKTVALTFTCSLEVPVWSHGELHYPTQTETLSVKRLLTGAAVSNKAHESSQEASLV